MVVVALGLRHDESARPQPGRRDDVGFVAPMRPSAMLARMLSSNSVTSWLTMAIAFLTLSR